MNSHQSGIEALAGFSHGAPDRLKPRLQGNTPPSLAGRGAGGNTPPSLAGRGAGGVGYLLLQAAIITALLLNRQQQDFFALLFIPISLSAVLYYGKRGFWWVAAFALALAVPLIAPRSDWRLGAVLVLNYGGLCFLFGGYAYQVRRAEAARRENQRVYGELQVAHGRLRQSANQREELAAEQERNRLARELHDSVSQTIFSVTLTSQAARVLLDRDPTRVPELLDRICGGCPDLALLDWELPGMPAETLLAPRSDPSLPPPRYALSLTSPLRVTQAPVRNPKPPRRICTSTV